MEPIFSLGSLYISDFVETMNHSPEKYDLSLVYDESRETVKIKNPAPKGLMYGEYWYRSGINDSMRKELKDIVNSIYKVKKVKDGDVWVDIACNDGTLFEFVDPGVYKIGIDPADDSYLAESSKRSDVVIQDFFSAESFFRNTKENIKADVVTSIAVFYDIETPETFIRDVRKIIKDDGVWVLQLSYTPLMLTQLAFDNICHEHLFYYSLSNLSKLFLKNGFKILDCQLNETNGGSFRIYAIPTETDAKHFATKAFRDVAEFRIKSVLELEKNMLVNSPNTWKKFYSRVLDLKKNIRNFILSETSKGKKIWGYGASTKGNTLLQFFGLDSSLIEGIAERSPYKYGLKTVGTMIPIYSEEKMREVNPDYLLILPWHFIDEFTEREKQYLLNGGKFIVPCPEFRIITSNDLK